MTKQIKKLNGWAGFEDESLVIKLEKDTLIIEENWLGKKQRVQISYNELKELLKTYEGT